MSSLPMKEAVRTCLLSTRLKDLFTSISNIELDGVLRNKALRNRFMKFSDGFLSLRKDISMDRFRLGCGPGIDYRKINEWMLWNSRFTCKTLLTLRLFNLPSLVLTIPTHCCLPKLKVLHLNFLKFSDDESIRRLLSGCNSLEELLVQSCELSNLNKLNVCHRTLKRLTISGGDLAPSCELEINTPNLVCFDFGYIYCEETRLLLRNLNSLSEARICIGFIVNRCPCLETLAFELEDFGPGDWRTPKKDPSCLQNHIKAIKIFALKRKHVEFQLVEYLLKKAGVLESLTVEITCVHDKERAENDE
ncbi:hypothetical protein V6Z11_D13G168300 [Gossypium hirsutum]